ncbi:MAG: HAD family phosphatase [Methanobacteriota archaeon]|nr:MAG: HAD family phosphatase [Euryarchaeota archaeon]
MNHMTQSIADFFPILGIIFDMDGVLADTEPLSCLAFRKAIEEVVGFDMGEDYRPIIGLSLRDAVELISQKFGRSISSVELQTISERKEEIYFQIAKGRLVRTVGLDNFLEWLSQSDIGFAIASSGSIDKIRFTLTELDLIDFFQNRYFSSSMVQKGKPFPDLFNYVAKKMGWPAEKVIVIEDSPLGIQAAIAANMIPIGLTSSFSFNILQSAGARMIVQNFVELLP